MNLEDHLGDIIRKARLMSNISARDAAVAAGLAEADLTRLEDTGHAPQSVNYARLADRLGLHGAKLAGIAEGWTPAVPDLRRWQELRVISTTAEGMTVNCYLVWSLQTREAALFDTGWDASPVRACLASHQLQLRHVFLTHTHADHIAALGAVRAAFPQAQIHSNSRNAPADQRLQAGASLAVGGLSISFRETPGHAADGVTYIITGWPGHPPPVAIVGDAIFAGSIGRGNQSWTLAKQKVREHILTLPAATLLCPGHGPLTTVAEEQAANPFFT